MSSGSRRLNCVEPGACTMNNQTEKLYVLPGCKVTRRRYMWFCVFPALTTITAPLSPVWSRKFL